MTSPILFDPKLYIHVSCAVDGVGPGFLFAKFCIMSIFCFAAMFRHSFHLLRRKKYSVYKDAVRKKLRVRIRIWLLRQSLSRFVISSSSPSYLSDKVTINSHINRYKHFHIANAKKTKSKFTQWEICEGRRNHLCTLAYLFILLILCGDVHPNPGPVLQPHRRNPKAESLVTAIWNVHTLLEKKRSHV